VLGFCVAEPRLSLRSIRQVLDNNVCAKFKRFKSRKNIMTNRSTRSARSNRANSTSGKSSYAAKAAEAQYQGEGSVAENKPASRTEFINLGKEFPKYDENGRTIPLYDENGNEDGYETQFISLNGVTLCFDDVEAPRQSSYAAKNFNSAFIHEVKTKLFEAVTVGFEDIQAGEGHITDGIQVELRRAGSSEPTEEINTFINDVANNIEITI
jgi:hypothetical protein